MTPLQKGFVAVSHGQVHYRYGGRGPVVVMVNGSPRSSVALAQDVAWLGEHFTVIALDAPGCGNSTPLPQSAPGTADYAAALADALTALGIERCAVYGVHEGARIALRFAADHADRAALTILDALPDPTTGPGQSRRVLSLLEPAADGSHLPRLWNNVLDTCRYGLESEPSAATRLAVELPDDLELHEHATDLLMAGPHWTGACDAMSQRAVAADLARLRSRAVFMCREDDPRYTGLDRLPEPLPISCSVERIPPSTAAWRTRLLDLLKHANLPDADWHAPQTRASDGERRPRQAYVDQVHGQIRVQLHGAAGGVPLLLLHDVPGGSNSMRALAAAFSASRLTIAPDLPGLGESHPLPYPSLGSYVAAVVEMLDHFGCDTVDVLAEGLGACFAVALAARHPQLVRRVALDALPLVRSRDRKLYARHYCPRIVPDRHGTHLLRAWQQLREQEASWPWFDRSAGAARRHDPEFDPVRMQERLLDVLKQLPSYGDAARAALEAAVRDILTGVRQPVLLLDDARDVRYAGTGRAARHLADARILPRPATLGGRADALRQFFD